MQRLQYESAQVGGFTAASKANFAKEKRAVKLFSRRVQP